MEKFQECISAIPSCVGNYVESLVSERWIEISVVIVLGIAWRWFIEKNIQNKFQEKIDRLESKGAMDSSKIAQVKAHLDEISKSSNYPKSKDPVGYITLKIPGEEPFAIPEYLIDDQSGALQTIIIAQPGATYDDFRSESGNYHIHFDGKGEIVSPKPIKIEVSKTYAAEVTGNRIAEIKNNSKNT